MRDPRVEKGELMERLGGWIQTYSGVEFYPLDSRSEEVRLQDIAHALANICRFTGHCRTFYSVAEHSIWVSRICDPADALWGLLHDASEAYICDLARPVKKGTKLGQIYEEVEAGIMAAVCGRFNLSLRQPLSVGVADKGMLRREYELLIPHQHQAWDKWRQYLTGKEPASLECLSPANAELAFMERFAEVLHAAD